MTPPKQTKGDSIFPSLLVLPHNTGKSKSARRRARRRGRDMAWSYCEMLWAYFTFLDGGSPYKRIDQQRLLAKARSSTWTSLHAAYAGFLHDEIHRYTCLRCDDEPLSRGILKLSGLVKVVRNSTYSGNTDIDKLSRVAKSVKPSRMSLPAAAGIIDPSKFLKGSHLEAFENMSTQVPHGVEPPNPTMGCYKVAPEDISEVNHRLLSSGVATLIPESMGMRNSKGEIITGGLFAVDHKPQSDRIILDRRPFNELERRLVWAKLPHGSLLTQLIVPKGYSVRGSGDDLSNYFYLLKHRNDWLPRNAIGKPFDGEGYETYGGEKGKKYLLAFKVIAMGDLNAVDLAQQVHLEVLKDCSCMNEGECIEFKEPLPAAHTMEGLYIDDHIITQILPSKKNRKKGYKYRDEVLIERSREQYAKHGIPTSQNKSFDKAEKFVAWGTELDSHSGRAGAPLLKLKQLSSLLARVCKLKVVSKKLLQGVTGLLVHPFMHRRSMMCLLQDTFIWIENLEDGDRKPMPISVREELLSCGLMLPLCHSNVRWPISSRLGASDASLSMGGRAATLVTPGVSQTLYRFAEHKGEHVRLDWEKGAVQPPSSMRPAPRELELLISDLPWNQTETCSFGHKQHINILELKMILRELQDLVHQGSDPLRFVLLVDSRAAAGAWSKGRSSSKNLNRILRRALGWTLLGRKTLHLVWVRSECNPADYPSRGKRIPEPTGPPNELSKEIFGKELDHFRTRRSNRDIWREVRKQQSDAGDPISPEPDGLGAGPKNIRKPQRAMGKVEHPAAKGWSFREIFAGSGHLTSTFRKRNNFTVQTPVEIMQNGRVDPHHDILNDAVFERLCKDASKPKQLWHFGFPCGSFSILQNMNKGTRTKHRPEGDDSLQRERLGNQILRRTIHLCHLLHAHGSFFTLENPLSSWAWKMPEMCHLLSSTGSKIISLDQCMLGLKIPHNNGVMRATKKPTIFAGTMPHLEGLSIRCSHDHEHVAVLGGVKWGNKWQKRSSLAGNYPARLCQTYSRCFEKAFL